MAAAVSADTPRLNLEAVVGFGGNVVNGLIYLPDGVHIVYPLGSTVVIKNVLENTQAFLQGHTDKVTCIGVSRDGRRIASGQAATLGQKAPVIVWDVEAAIRNKNTAVTEGEMLHQLVLHKGGVRDVAFSLDGDLLATLGGLDDNSLVIWNAETGAAICGSPAASHAALSVRWSNTNNTVLVTGGFYNLRLWELDIVGRKLNPTDCSLGSLRRVIQCIAIDDTDTVMYCGTQTGDLLEVNAKNGRFIRAGRNRFSQGISVVSFIPGRYGSEASVLIGNGDGSVAVIAQKTLSVERSAQLAGKVTSVSTSGDGTSFFAGTDAGNTYRISIGTLEAELLSTAHAAGINDICFPEGCSDLCITCSKTDIRVWNVATRMELLRIQVPNLECMCVAISPNGASIVSGWDDGKIRAFYPQSGKLQYVISDAHAESVTALAITHDNSRVVSGGRDGRVRVWNVSGQTQVMEHSFKEHKRAVSCIRLSHDDSEAVSAAADGSCIIWNIARGTRVNALFAATVFRSVLYHPDESQLLTCGSDRKITYWDSSDCNAIRIMDGSSEEVRSLAIDPDGKFFVSGSNDKLVKLWDYDEGTLRAVGIGHSGAVQVVQISPDQSRIVSVGAEGAIFFWTSPPELARDLRASGYAPKAGARDEIDDATYGIPKSYADLKRK